jgi:hypothetical protein
MIEPEYAPRDTARYTDVRDIRGVNVEAVMPEIKIGDRVEVCGNTQSYILTDPNKVYRGKVVGKGDGELLVRLDEPVIRGPGQFKEVSVPEREARLISN